MYISIKGDIKSPSPYYDVPAMTKYRRSCDFKFKFEKYPLDFDSTLPMYSGRLNPDIMAYSRDHMVSVSEGFKQNIDPKIISHPANCRLITQLDNVRKSVDSCITIEELINRIEEWNIKYPK